MSVVSVTPILSICLEVIRMICIQKMARKCTFWLCLSVTLVQCSCSTEGAIQPRSVHLQCTSLSLQPNGSFSRNDASEKRRQNTVLKLKGKGSPYSTAEHRVPELIPVLGSQPAGDVSHKPSYRLSLPSATPAVTFVTLKRTEGDLRGGGVDNFHPRAGL